MNVNFTGRIARASARRPWVTIAAWAIGLTAAIVAAGSLGDALSQDDRNTTVTQSDKANQIVERERGDTQIADIETIIIKSVTAKYGDAAFTAVVAETTAALLAIDGVTAVSGTDAQSPPPVSASLSTALLSATLALDHPETVGENINAALAAVDHDGFTVLPYGNASVSAMFDGLAEDTLIKGELVGIGVAIVILIIVFGSLAASSIPLGVALVSITAAMGATAILGRAFSLSFFITNMITMMGLALGIDYTLVVVQRFREELARGRTVIDAVSIAGSTASRAVLFSGVTVLFSLVGLLVVPNTIMISLGTGAIVVAVMSILSALTLLPAVLKLLGHRVNKGRVPTAHPGREPKTWEGIARTVIRRPAVSAFVGLALLVAIAAPALSMRLTFAGAESLPEDNSFRVATEILVDDFGYGQSSTVIAIENAGSATPQVEALARAVEADAAFAETELTWQGDVAFIDTKDVYDSADERAEQALHALRDTIVPEALEGTSAVAYVGGEQAGAIDFADIMRDATPWVLLIVLGASFFLLLLLFRSIVIPSVAIALNLLSTAAAYGVLVAVFQFGWGERFLGMPQVDGIAPWIPLFLFAVLFGLSMDYHVFLLSRIKERYESTQDTRDAVVFGLSRTGSLITGAALIMVAVFAGFALGDLAEFAQMGVGLAAAIIIDATIVRSILVPALMALLGNANWYLPAWLNWLPVVHFDGHAPTSASALEEPERESISV